MKIHPAAELFPLLEGDAFNELVADIRANGLIEPIITMGEEDDLTLLDGRNRLRACEEARVPPRFTPYQGDDPVGFVVSKNLRRRDLTPDQKAAIAADLATMPRGGDRRSEEFSNRRGGGLKTDAPMTKAEASQKMGVSKRRTERVATVVKQAPDLHAKVKSGEMTLATAEKEVKQRAPRGSVKAAREEKKRAKAAAQEKHFRNWETRIAESRALLQEAAQVLRASQQFGQDQKKLKRLIDVFSYENMPLFNPAHEFFEALFEGSGLPEDDPESEDEGEAQAPLSQEAQGEPEQIEEPQHNRKRQSTRTEIILAAYATSGTIPELAQRMLAHWPTPTLVKAVGKLPVAEQVALARLSDEEFNKRVQQLS